LKLAYTCNNLDHGEEQLGTYEIATEKKREKRRTVSISH